MIARRRQSSVAYSSAPWDLVSVVACRPAPVDLLKPGCLPFVTWASRLPRPRDLALSSLPAYQRGMAKRLKQLPQDRGFILFDVVFEDGSRASNRRMPMEILSGFDGDEPARDLMP